jgi:D-glycero-D-manno-heptose 1,7-bisphosphate phosphatase
MIRLVIFDRDGVINELIQESNIFRSPRSISEVVIDSTIKSLMQNLDAAGVKLAIASNQPEISRGFITRETLLSINNEILKTLGLKVNFFICPHDDVDDCLCRKPKPGLLLQIVEQFGIPIREVIFIGDRNIDMLAASEIGMQFLLYRDGGGLGIFELTLPDGETLSLHKKGVFDWIVSH